MTVQEYLDWASAQADLPRTELVNGQVVAMTPERVAHAEIKLAVVIALKAAIARAGVPCHALPDGPTVPIDDHTAYEPDALAYCGPKLPPTSLIVPKPTIVVEVLSPTTRHTDTSAKLVGYFKLSSVSHYLIIDPDARSVTHHARTANGTIAPNVLTAGTISLDPPGITLNVTDLFG